MTQVSTAVSQTLVSTLRALSLDMVEAANSGHPGLPLGAAPMAAALFGEAMDYDPGEPGWANRDRFVLSPGHGSALLYACLHVFGFDLPMDELRRFRQIGSKTPGHPENFMTSGVECTTGPLGQGLGNAVGMAMAEAWLAARYNAGGAKVVDHFTYAIVSDGDLMEGIAQEAASLAGHLKLGKLVALYDSNDICLDGECANTYSENVGAKFEAMGWHFQRVEDGNDVDKVLAAVGAAKQETSRPSLIEVKTVIGFGSPLAGTSKAHGAPLGAEKAAATKQSLGWELEPFTVPNDLADVGTEKRAKGERLMEAWHKEVAKLESANPGLAAEFANFVKGNLPDGWATKISELSFAEGKVATRDAGKSALNAIASAVPWLVGGGADLASSTKASIDGSGAFSASDRSGRNIWFGVREHAMGAIVNGLALHGLRPFGSTFLVFSDYMRGSIRLAALSKIPSLFVFSHDSVFVGEDGPTHQPIEHVASLRLIPGLDVYRPADSIETAECYRLAVATGKAACIVLTRQGLPVMSEFNHTVRSGVKRGAYVLHDSLDPDVVLVATGSEVSLALSALPLLEDVNMRVVSMPCVELFNRQDESYRKSVFPDGAMVVSVEAGVTSGWSWCDASVGIDRFGESGPGESVYEAVGMTVEHVVRAVRSVLR